VKWTSFGKDKIIFSSLHFISGGVSIVKGVTIDLIKSDRGEGVKKSPKII